MANRMKSSLEYPSNSRSFFVPDGKQAIGGGFELWRGFFQSLRPGIGKLLLNVDVSTGLIFRPGPLIELCREFLGHDGRPFDPKTLSHAGLNDGDRIRLQRFIFGIRVSIKAPSMELRIASIKKISRLGAGQIKFKTSEGQQITVADYFRQKYNAPLRYPQIFCVEVSSSLYV